MQTDRSDLVSIIIPCYNASAYIAEAINSVLSQTYKCIEIIVVNDGSTDNSEKIIKTFNNSVIYKCQNNQGVAAARNTGYRSSKGEYICFLDADDWFYPENIDKKINYLKTNPEIGLVHSIVEITDENLVSTGKYLKGKAGDDLTQSLLNFELPIPCPSNVLIKRDVLNKIGLFDVNLSTSADFELWLRACSLYQTGMINEVGIKYRQHSSNMFSNKNLYQKDTQYIIDKHAPGSKYNWSPFIYKKLYSLMLNSIKEKNMINAAYYFYRYLKAKLEQ